MTETGTHWYAVHCRPSRENQVATAIQDTLGLTVYLPTIQQGVRGQPQGTLLFPHYLFVRANLQETTPGHIQAIPGVIRVVGSGAVPQPIPAPIIEALHGDPGAATWEPLQGTRLEELCLGNGGTDERVRCFMAFLDDLSKVQAAPKAAEHPPAAPSPRRQRRTRGKGRKIAKTAAEPGPSLRNRDGNETMG
jgi:transcription antitermination factor NusG